MASATKPKFGRETVLKVGFPQLNQTYTEQDRGVRRFDLSKNWESSTLDWSTTFLSPNKPSPHYSSFFRSQEDNSRQGRLYVRQLCARTSSVTPASHRLVSSQLSNYPEPKTTQRTTSSNMTAGGFRTTLGNSQPLVLKQAEETFGVTSKNMHRMIKILDNHRLYTRFENRRPGRLATSRLQTAKTPLKD
jgi:hypothetical protein